KMVVPTTHSQIQTFVAFGYAMLTQREMFFEMLGLGPENQAAARFAEAALQRDLDHNKFNSVLYQFLLDCGRFGLGVLKTSWVEETQMVDVTVEPRKLSFLGMTMPAGRRKVNREERI